MKKNSIAKRYASALFSIMYREYANEAEQNLEMLHCIAKLCNTNAVFMSVLVSPVITEEEKATLIISILQYSGHVFPLLEKFCIILIRAHRMELFPEVVLAYDALVQKKEHRTQAIVTTAYEFSNMEKEQLHGSLAHIDEHLELSYSVNPSLLGGFTVQFGDMLLDSSLKKQLELFRERIIKGGCYAN